MAFDIEEGMSPRSLFGHVSRIFHRFERNRFRPFDRSRSERSRRRNFSIRRSKAPRGRLGNHMINLEEKKSSFPFFLWGAIYCRCFRAFNEKRRDGKGPSNKTTLFAPPKDPILRPLPPARQLSLAPPPSSLSLPVHIIHHLSPIVPVKSNSAFPFS